MLALDIDIRDKNHSQGLDDALHQLRNSSCSIAFKPGIETVDNTSVHPAILHHRWEWVSGSNGSNGVTIFGRFT